MSAPAGQSTPDDALRRAMDAFFASYYRLRPVNATFTGIHTHDGAYPDWSPAGVEQARGEMRGLRDRLAQAAGPALGTLGSGSTPEWPLIDATLADAFLEIQLRELGGFHMQRGNPSLAIGEAAFGLISLIIRPYAPAVERAESLAARLRALPLFLEGAQASLSSTPLRPAWCDKAQRELEGLRLLLAGGLRRWVAIHLPDGQAANRILGATEPATAAVDRFALWLAQAPRDTSANYGCGREMLSLLLSRGHWYRGDLDAWRLALRAQLAEEQGRLADRAHHEHADGWAGVQAELAQRHPGPDSYYDAFARTWQDCHALAAARDVVSWPDYPIRYVPIPEWTREAAPFLYYLYYRSPAAFDQVQPVEYVVTPIESIHTDDAKLRHLRSWNDSVIKLNHVVHHGAIGHHVQNWYAYRAPSRIGQVAAIDCAARIGMFCGGTMAEGWACYATDLMDEIGFLTPYESVAEQHTRVRMLARAIVDLELHGGQMSLADAEAFYGAEVGMPAEVARGEAVKNSMFPGTASMYWLGTQGIHDLRGAIARQVGAEKFSLRGFHDALLSMGSIPVAVSAELLLRQGLS
ncbi:MAG: DUF885 family protein [Gemmatimonadaceae bacterium]